MKYRRGTRVAKFFSVKPNYLNPNRNRLRKLIFSSKDLFKKKKSYYVNKIFKIMFKAVLHIIILIQNYSFLAPKGPSLDNAQPDRGYNPKNSIAEG